MRREWIEIVLSAAWALPCPSPSMRREWIEIKQSCYANWVLGVSLHAEGVD